MTAETYDLTIYSYAIVQDLVLGRLNHGPGPVRVRGGWGRALRHLAPDGEAIAVQTELLLPCASVRK